MKKFFFLSMFLLSLFFASCSYRSFPGDSVFSKINSTKINAFVTNKMLEEEFNILDNSNIYNIVSIRSEADVEIELLPMVCKDFKNSGTGMVISTMTLYQVATKYPDDYTFRFNEIKGNSQSTKEIKFTVVERVWFWNIFKKQRKFEDVAGEALANKYASANI